jgi:hypothetical protein
MTDSEKLSALLVGQAEILEKVSLLVAGSPVNAAPVKGAIADDSDLNGKYGDPIIRMNIPAFKWKGQQYKGKNMSEVRDAAFLEAYAEQLEWSAAEDVKNKKTYMDKKTGEEKLSDGKLSRMDAARARGWRKRLLEKPTAGLPVDADGEIPF